MNNRQRLSAILDGQPPDRIPWIPRLKIWYTARKKTGTMPTQWRDLSLREIERALGVGTPARDGRIYERKQDGVEVTTRREASASRTT